jgi:uncharacterized membrane protein
MKDLSSPYLIVLILFVGLIVRLYDLNGESLWTDEGHTIFVSSLDLPQLIEENINDNHPPLYSILLHFWMKLFQPTLFNLRLLSLIFGVLSIFLVYKVGEVLLNRTVGLISAGILSLSVFHIYYSQEVRSYSFVVALILLSFFLFIRLTKKPKPIDILFFIGVNVLMVYTHFLGWFIILSQSIFYIFRFPINKKRLKDALIINFVTLVLYIPWLKVMISRLSSIEEEFWVMLPSWLTLPQTFLIYAGTYTFFGVCLFVVFCTLCLFGLFRYHDGKIEFRRKDNEQKYLLLLWLFVPILAPFILSYIIAPVYITRLTIGASLAFYLLSAYGLSLIDKKQLRYGILLLIILFSLGNLAIYYDETNKERWDEVTTHVESRANPGDLLLFHAGFGLDKAFNFYANRDDLIKQKFPAVGLKINQDHVEELRGMIADFDRVWLILSHSRDKENLIIKTIKKQFKLSDHRQYISFSINSHRPYVGIEIFLFSNKSEK